MKAGRNALCPCGSGLKHKHCCAGKAAWYRRPKLTAAVLALLLMGSVVLAGVMITRPDSAAAPGADGADAPGTADFGPPGPAPPGKVWSAEHGHWHDAP